jgi:hypothetical protein
MIKIGMMKLPKKCCEEYNSKNELSTEFFMRMKQCYWHINVFETYPTKENKLAVIFLGANCCC